MADEPTPTSEEGGKTFTQEQLDKIIEDRLARERDKFKDYDDLKSQVATLVAEKKKLEDEGKSDSQKLADQVAALQSQLEDEKTAREKSERAALRARVGSAAKLPPELADLLQGDDEDALKAHAETLAGLIGGQKDDKPASGGRPKETLRPGASNEDDEPEIDAKKGDEIAKSILNPDI